MAGEFKLKAPLPKYRSTDILVKYLIEYITTGGFVVGSEFLSDKDLVTQTGRSRTAVRRALEVLQNEGWIRRQGGKGTFVGDRLAEYQKSHNSEEKTDSFVLSSSSSQAAENKRENKQQSAIRVAVAVSGLRDMKHEIGDSWYYGEILRGIDEMAVTENIVMEFLGYHGSRSHSLSRRLGSNRPDVFLCIGPPMNHASLIGLAGRWEIPCVMAATRAPELGLPNIYEDSVTAAHDAVEHLVQLGHQRIGFLQVMSPSGWWAFDRYEGYLKGMRKFHLEKDNELGLWLPLHPSEETTDMIRRYLEKNRLTALVCGSFWAAGHLTNLIRKNELRIPQDLSCVVFDQEPVVKHLLGGVTPTTVQLPLKEIGRTFVGMVHSLAEHKKIPSKTVLPCLFVQGDSTIACTNS